MQQRASFGDSFPFGCFDGRGDWAGDLREKPAEKAWPAGLAKVMTLYLAYDALKGGLQKPDQKVVVREGEIVEKVQKPERRRGRGGVSP